MTIWTEQTPLTVPRADKSKEQLERDELVRQTLESAARAIEQQNVNSTYKQALKKGAKLIREMKP